MVYYSTLFFTFFVYQYPFPLSNDFVFFHALSTELPETTLGTFLQTKLNKYLDQQRDRIDPVVVRVVNIRNKTFGANKETLEFYQAKGEPFPNELTYRSKALFVFQKQGGQKRQAHDVCFFG